MTPLPTKPLTTQELAEQLQVTAGTVRTWVADGRIPVIRASRKVMRFDPVAVRTALEVAAK